MSAPQSILPALRTRRLLPHALTTLRMALAIPVLAAASAGETRVYMTALVLAFLTELDGTVARWLDVASDFGRRFDTWADLVIELSAFAGFCLLWPGVLQAEWWWLMAGFAALALEVLWGVIRIGGPFSYHTLLARGTGFCAALGTVVFFISGSFLLIRLAAVAQILVMLEYGTISVLRPAHRGMIPSVWHAWTGRS